MKAKHPSEYKEKINAYLREWAGKRSAFQIAVDLDIEHHTVQQYAALLGVSLKNVERKTRRLKLDDFIIQHGSKMTAYEIGIAMRLPREMVYNRAWFMGIELKKERYSPEPMRVRNKKVLAGYFDDNELKNMY